MPKQVTDQDRLALNLETLGKLSRGDMLAAAGEDGKFVRKTNFLTQAWRKSETHDQQLFTQIKAVLDEAKGQIDNQDAQDGPLALKYIQALKGLEVLLSTYRSKGSKEFAYIEQLTLVLNAHNLEIKPDPDAGKLIDLAKRAIHYVEDCRIRSTNVFFLKHGGGHQGKYFGYKVDDALLELFVRCDDATFESRRGTVVEYARVRDAVLKIMQQSVSRSEKRTLLEKKLNELLGGDGRSYTTKELLRLVPVKDQKPLPFFKRSRFQPKGERALMDDRLRSAQHAIRMRFGNCHQKACVVATWLSENTECKNITIARVGAAAGYDHSWVFISRDAKLIDAIESCGKKTNGNAATYKDLFPRDTVVVDGWTADCWGLRDWFNSVGNPRQLNVRRKIRKHVENGQLKELFEKVEWPPVGEYSNFRLRFANMPDWGWHLRKSSSVPAEVRQSIEDRSQLHEAATEVSHHSMRTISEMSDSVEYEDEYPYRLLHPR